MKLEEIVALLEMKFAGAITGKKLDALDPYVVVAPAAIADVCRYCRDEPQLRFDYLRDLCGVDWLIADEKRAKKLNVEPHLEILYQLFSFPHKHYLTLKVVLERWKHGRAGDLPELQTVSNLWRVAEWHEREIYDLLGVHFAGHPNLRRILCAEDWVGHPLRKDYEFPLEYHGIRCR